MIQGDPDRLLEEAIKRVEDDSSFLLGMVDQLVDLRATRHIGSIAALHELIHSDGFDMYLSRSRDENGKVVYTTLFGRKTRRAFLTNHRMVESVKGWLVFDTIVPTLYNGSTW